MSLLEQKQAKRKLVWNTAFVFATLLCLTVLMAVFLRWVLAGISSL